jgi:hypothetical protein
LNFKALHQKRAEQSEIRVPTQRLLWTRKEKSLTLIPVSRSQEVPDAKTRRPEVEEGKKNTKKQAV